MRSSKGYRDKSTKKKKTHTSATSQTLKVQQLDRLPDRLRARRLCEEQVAAALHRSLFALVRAESREHDYRRGSPSHLVFQGSDAFRGFEAVEYGHGEVHEDEIERSALTGLEGVYRRLAVGCEGVREAYFFDAGAEDLESAVSLGASGLCTCVRWLGHIP